MISSKQQYDISVCVMCLWASCARISGPQSQHLWPKRPHSSWNFKIAFHSCYSFNHAKRCINFVNCALYSAFDCSLYSIWILMDAELTIQLFSLLTNSYQRVRSFKRTNNKKRKYPFYKIFWILLTTLLFLLNFSDNIAFTINVTSRRTYL